MSLKFLALGLAASALLLAGCQTSGSENQPVAQLSVPPAAKPYGGEDRDWDVASTDALRTGSYHAPTPVTLSGAKPVTTHALAGSLKDSAKPVLVNVLTGKWVAAVPGSVWLSGAGQGGSFDDPAQARLAKRLEELTGGDKARPIVFYCLSAECWLSYNAALRARRLGYANAGWYRGGMESWKAAGLPVERIDRDQW